MAEILRFVNTASTAGGDGTTNATSGANRAYVSQNEAEAAEQVDLVAAGDTFRLVCEGTAEDTAQVSWTGWTTTVANNITIETDIAAASGRNDSGEFSTSHYRLSVIGSDYMMRIEQGGTIVEGLQFNSNGTGSVSNAGIRITNGIGSSNRVLISKCFFNSSLDSEQTGGNPYGIFVTVGGGKKIHVKNCIAGGFTRTDGKGSGLFTDFADLFCYNMTAVNCDTGFESTVSDKAILKNCVAKDNTDGYSGTWKTGSTTNVSDIASDAPGTSPITGSVTFLGSSFLLDPADSVAKNAATDLSSDATIPFSDDIIEVSRPQGADWDCGASEAQEVGVFPLTTLNNLVGGKNKLQLKGGLL